MSTDFQPDWTMPLSEYARVQKENMPQIKPLVWQRGNPQINEWIAETPLGKFRVIKRSHDACAVIYMAPFRSMVSPDLVDVEETKAACEQEYERRVRECLE